MKASAGKRPRRTLIIVENLPVPFDRRVWQEARTLKAAGYEVDIICPTGKGHTERYEELEGIRIHRHPLPVEGRGAFGYVAEYSVALFYQLWFAIRIYSKHGFDLIHACNPPDNIFLVALPFKLLGVRFLFDHHDINPELFEAKFNKRGLLYQVVLLWEKLTFRLADVSIATNESYRAIAVDRGGMAPADVHVVRSGPDLKRLKRMPPKEVLREGKRYLVGYVGVMGEQEGIDLLLEAIAYMVKERQRQDVHFALVGGGTARPRMEQLSRDLGVSDYVTFHGRVEDEILLEVLNTADVCVNPDRANEMNDKSTMNKIMEYMALGKPIVQFDLTEGRFSAQAASLYAKRNNPRDFADKILKLLDDPELRDEMSRCGRERVCKELAWEYEAPKLLKAYDNAFRH